VEGFVVVIVLEKVEVLMEFWSLWWFKWDGGGGWRSCSCCGCGGDEGKVDGG